MLLTENKLRKIIAEEYAELQKEAESQKYSREVASDRAAGNSTPQKEYDVIFTAIKKIGPQLKSANSTEEVEKLLQTVEGGIFWNNKKWLGALQGSSTVRSDDKLSKLMSPIFANHLRTLR